MSVWVFQGSIAVLILNPHYNNCLISGSISDTRCIFTHNPSIIQFKLFFQDELCVGASILRDINQGSHHPPQPLPMPQVRIPTFPKFFQMKIIDVAMVNQRSWLEESGQWLEYVNPTHLVLASGKPVLQKKDLTKN